MFTIIKLIMATILMVSVHVYLIFFWPGFRGLLWFIIPTLLFLSVVYDCYKMEMKIRRDKENEKEARIDDPE